MSATFQVRQMSLTKELVDNTENPYEITLAIARVNDSLEARGISYEDKEELLEVCEEIVREYSLEVNPQNLFAMMVDGDVMDDKSVAELVDNLG